MGDIQIQYQDTSDGVTVQTGQKYQIVLETTAVEVFLHDVYRKPLPGAPFELRYGERSVRGKTDDDAKAIVRMLSPPERCIVRWSSNTEAEPDEFEYEREIFLRLKASDAEEGQVQRLHNLGLPSFDDFALSLGMFQSSWDLAETQQSDDQTVTKLDEVVKDRISHDEQADESSGDDSSERT